MDLSVLRVGFVPMSKDLKHPFDMRNFIYYARRRGIKFEIADLEKSYDVIILSPCADVSVWSRYRGSARIIYLIVDPYLAVSPRDIKGALRGLAKYISGEHKHLRFDYSGAVREMCSRADAVVCTTLEQKCDIQGYCKNVHIVLECHFQAVREVKTDYSAGRRINLVWEGRAESIHGFLQVKDVLIELRKKYPIALHLITDLVRGKYMNRYGKISVPNEVKRIFGSNYLPSTAGGHDSLVYLYQWNLEVLSRIIAGCDIAIIPLDISDVLRYGKPENKLLFFWRMGLPVVVSAIPAYERAMAKSGSRMFCRNSNEWRIKLEELIVDSESRKAEAIKGKECADTIYSEEAYLKQWDHLFRSVLDK